MRPMDHAVRSAHPSLARFASGLAIAVSVWGWSPADSAPPPAPAAPDAPSGRLELVVAVVSSTLEVRPVPKLRFAVQREENGEKIAEVVTSFEGKATLELPPGSYRIVSAEPLAFEGRRLSWQVPFEISAGGLTHLELSEDNAQREALAVPVADETELYRRVRDRVFRIESDRGHGSGFLVDAAGLIATNYHVVGNARYLAAETSERVKVPAQLVASDAQHDLAIVRVHPSLVEGLEPIPLAQDGERRLAEGEKVLAIGNPLSQTAVVTLGIVSRVQPDAIISDVDIAPGNSGGPMLNMRGEAVGINTFRISGQGGTGISGTVRIGLLRPLLEQARQALAGREPPPAERLPVVPETPYPQEALKTLLTTDAQVLRTYRVEARAFNVQFLTPVVLHSLARAAELKAAEQQEKRRKKKKDNQEGTYDPTEDFFEWQKHAGVYDAVVIVQAIPEIRMTGGSLAGRIFGAMAGVYTPARYRFKRDFREMQLLRDGQPVAPIHPGRNCEAVSAGTTLDVLQDVGCYGVYTYRPEVFLEGRTFELVVRHEENPGEPIRVTLGRELIERIRADFAPWRQAAQ